MSTIDKILHFKMSCPTCFQQEELTILRVFRRIDLVSLVLTTRWFDTVPSDVKNS